MPLDSPLNSVEMTKDDALDSYLLLPCRDDGAEGGKGNGGKRLDHNITGCFEIENSPLRINTIYFIGTPRKLRNYLKRKEGVELGMLDSKFDESFKGIGGLTFTLDRADGSSLVVIWMPKFDWSMLDIETLSHECLHASVMVMRMSGVKSRIFTATKEEDVDDEGLCYQQSTMLTRLLKRLLVKQNRKFSKSIEGK